VGKKGNKRGQIGKIERYPGEGERAAYSPPQTSFSPTPIFFCFFPQCGAWSPATKVLLWLGLDVLFCPFKVIKG